MRIRTLRISLNLSQREFSDSIGISRNSLAQIEFGNQLPTIKVIADISKRYKLSIDYLVTGGSEYEEHTVRKLERFLNFRLDYYDATNDVTGKYLIELHVANSFTRDTGHYIAIIITGDESTQSLEDNFTKIAAKVRLMYIDDLVNRVNEKDLRWIQRIPLRKTDKCMEVNMNWEKILRVYNSAVWRPIEDVPLSPEHWKLISDIPLMGKRHC